MVDNEEADMSIAFARAKIIARSAGQNAVACAAYRSGEVLRDRTEGTTHYYDRRTGIIDTGITAPREAPAWMRNRAELWNQVEAGERRKDAQLAREFIVAIPHELETEGQMAIREIARSLADRGMVVDWAIHQPSREGDERNVHAHLLTTMRKVTPEGFGAKVREWNQPDYLKGVKAEIAEAFNSRLRARGLPEIDLRSYEEQGIDRIPQQHMGVVATAMQRRGKRPDRTRGGEPEAREITAAEIERALQQDQGYQTVKLAQHFAALSPSEYAAEMSRLMPALKAPNPTPEQEANRRRLAEALGQVEPAMEAERTRPREQQRDRQQGRGR